MDDILLASKQEGLLLAYAHSQKASKEQGLVMTPEKVQTEPPYS